MATRFPLLMLSAPLALSACAATSRFQGPVGEFGRLTQAATEAQAHSLDAVTAAENERIHASLAASGADLRLDPACGQALAQPQPGAPRAACTLTARTKRADGGFDDKQIEQAPRFANIRALSDGLDDYAGSLVELAADRPEDEQAFTDGLTGLATSLSGLDAAVQQATGATATDHSARLAAIASLVAEGGRLLLAHRREQALRRIVLAADPIVQDATTRLFGVDSGLDLFERAATADRLNQAVRAQSAVAARGDPAALRAAQDRVFTLLAQYNSAPAITDRFVAIGRAHAALAAAARQGASPAEIKQAAAGLFDLAKTIKATADAFKPANEGASDDD